LKAYGVRDRRVWVADSFKGLPTPNVEKYPADEMETLHERGALAISADRVRAHFGKYDLLDDQVRFLEGYFRDTLPGAPIEKLAVLRLDGDMYESTMDTLEHLYPKLSPGGYLIVDDYARANCQQAVSDYRKKHGISDEIRPIDWTASFWQKSG
jgi:O-methyltransferase